MLRTKKIATPMREISKRRAKVASSIRPAAAEHAFTIAAASLRLPLRIANRSNARKTTIHSSAASATHSTNVCVSAFLISARRAPSGSWSVSAAAKASKSAAMSAIAKRTFCFLHSPANIEITHSCVGRSRIGRSCSTALQAVRFALRRQCSRQRLNRAQDFLSVEMRMHRQRQRGVRQRLAGRKLAGSIAQVRERRLQMQRHRIMNSALDLVLQKRVAQRVAPRAANDEEVKAGLEAVGLEDRVRVQRREQLAIRRGDHAAAFVPLPQLL